MSFMCTIKCDLCDVHLPDGPYKSLSEARTTARSVGWKCRTRGGHDFCPECAKTEGEHE